MAPEASASAPTVKKAAPTPRPLPNAVALDVVPQPVKKAAAVAVEPLASHLGIDHTMHTHMEVVDGTFTGRVVQPVCFGEGKIYWLQQLIESQGLDLAKSWFYTDSITDLPLLDLVGHPVVVNPDPLLHREARRRCWPVHLFEDPRLAARAPAA